MRKAMKNDMRKWTLGVGMLMFVFHLLAAVSSCSSIDCPVQNKVRTVYSIRSCIEATADTLKDTLTVVSSRLDKKDTILLSASYNITQFSLPIGYANPEDTLYFAFRNGPFRAIDTVWVKKENIPHFESVDCNATFFHRLTAIRSTHHAIDSITINNSSVTYDASAQHLYLYVKSRN